MSLRRRADTIDPSSSGLTRVHRGMSGNIIGGVTAEGQGLGTRKDASGKGGELRGLAKWAALNPGKKLNHQKPKETVAAAAGSPLLRRRQALHGEMQRAGAGGLTPEMRKRASGLGVTERGWNRAKGGLTQAPSMVARPGAPKVGAVSPLHKKKREPVNPASRVL